jgi:hypothetical protein
VKGRSAEGFGLLQERILVAMANSIATVIKQLMERYQFILILSMRIKKSELLAPSQQFNFYREAGYYE